MRFTASSTDYDFDKWKVKIDRNPQRRSVHVRHIDGKGEFKKEGVSEYLEIDFYDLDSDDKSDLRTVFVDDYGDLTAISNIDEVESGEEYYTYSGNMYIEKPTQVLKFRRTTNRKQIENYRTKMTVVCDTYATATKP
jgi:hypothetical protein